jgi:hypothetical protein
MITEDLEAFFDADEFGESVAYNGVDVDVVEHISGAADGSFERTGAPGFVVPRFVVVVNLGSTVAKEGDAVTFRGKKYHVGDDPKHEGNGLWRVDLIKKTVQV